jgi:hypothetical protein
MTGDDAHCEASSGSGIPEIEYARGLKQCANAGSANPPAASPMAFYRGAQGGAGACGRQNIISLKEPLDLTRSNS